MNDQSASERARATKLKHRNGPVTMADVGARAGVTARTVSNVLSDKSKVRFETRARVLAAIDELGYRMNTAARSLKTGRTGAITLAIPDLGIDYFGHLARLVMQEAERHGWAVVVEQTGGRRETELKILSGAQRQHSDGLIFQPHELGPEDARYLVGSDNIVMLGERIFDEPIDHVTMSNVDAAAAATRHLLDRGHTKIAVLGANPRAQGVNTASLRIEGYARALQNAGIAVNTTYLAIAEEWHLRDGASAMERLLALEVRPTAVFCLNDTLAFGALYAAHARGLSVPDDVAVIGFDNVPFAEFAVPPLTSIEPGTAQLAKLAVDLLAAQVDQRANAPIELFTGFSLVARSST